MRNRKEYNRACVNRGSLSIWFDEDSIGQGWTPRRPKGRGKPGLYSDLGMKTCLAIETLFRLSYRATDGLLGSLMKMSGVELPVPDHTHQSRRAASLTGKVPRLPRKGPTLNMVVETTEWKIFGEGGWKVRRHAPGARFASPSMKPPRDIIGIQVTTSDWADGQI
jgi:hypothetical protein